MEKKQVLQDLWYVEGVESACFIYIARLYEISYVEGVKRNKK